MGVPELLVVELLGVSRIGPWLATLQPGLAREFQRTEGAVIAGNMKRRQGGKSIQGPLFRGLAGRSATGRNDQAAAEEMWLSRAGGWMSKKYSCRSGGEKCFSLDIPFNRTSRSCGLLPDWRPTADAAGAEVR